MKESTIARLRSPLTHHPLQLIAEDDMGVIRQGLRDVNSGQQFDIIEGIPWLLDADRVVGYNKKYQRFYNLVAPLYDATLALGARLARGRVDEFRMEYINELELKPGAAFLEVSIGTGANLQYLPTNIECYGLDISWGMLKRCRRHLRRWQREVELVIGDAEELPFVNDQFDAVLHVGGINAFNDRARALAEMVRVARPGTRIVVVDETAKLINKFSWLPGARRMMKEYGERFHAPVELLPPGMLEVAVKAIVHGDLYCLSFRKPA